MSITSPATIARKEKALTQNIQLKNTTIVENKHIYSITGTRGITYEVTMTEKPECTCPDFTDRHCRCKHIYFVLMNILNIRDEDKDVYSLEELFGKNENQSTTSDRISEIVKNQSEVFDKISELVKNVTIDKSIVFNKIVFENVIDNKFKFLNIITDIITTIYKYIHDFYGIQSKENAIKFFENNTPVNEILNDNNFSGVYVIKITDDLYELHMKKITKTNNGWLFNNYINNVTTEKIARFIIVDDQ